MLLKRDSKDLKQLRAVRSNLMDPDSSKSFQPRFAKNYHRSLKAEYFIAYAVNAISGAEIKYRLKNYKHKLKAGAFWNGGFSEAQTGYVYDKAGRLYKQNNLDDSIRYNLYVPNYKITATNQLYVYTLKELDFD